MQSPTSQPLERPFLHLHQHHHLSAADLAQAFALSDREAEDIIRRAEARNERYQARLLDALFGSRR